MLKDVEIQQSRPGTSYSWLNLIYPILYVWHVTQDR